MCLFNSTLNHTRVQAKHSSGTTNPSCRLPNPSNYWSWKGLQKPLRPGKFSCLYPLKIIPSELCTLPLSNLHADFELAEHSFIRHWLWLQVPPLLLKQRERGAALLSGEVGESMRVRLLLLSRSWLPLRCASSAVLFSWRAASMLVPCCPLSFCFLLNKSFGRNY